ncbi:hypothetical protein [Xanthomonas cerealis]|uniref:hypothetical protein n=1 Tax=Xanthomonas cerealis TaxID=3390025 RepID=UPI000A69F7CB|nr:hypothetical protein [Xanthomonas translucens]UKE47954.1 hypothetical protein KHA79_04580 [Xanthomonas translucens pv. cerealis]
MKVSSETSSHSLSTDWIQEEESSASSSESTVHITPHQQAQTINPALAALPRRPGMRPHGGASTSSAAPSSVLGKRSAADAEDKTAARPLKKTSNREVVPIMTLLRSGGHRVDDQNNLIAYFVRQSPAQIDPEMLAQHLNSSNISYELPILSQRVPAKISHKDAYPADNFLMNRDLLPDEFTRSHVSVWGISRPRAYTLDRELDAPQHSGPLKKVGTYFEQKQNNYRNLCRDGVLPTLDGSTEWGFPVDMDPLNTAGPYHDYNVESHAAYASNKPQKPHGSPAAMDLPTSKLELWQFSVHTEEESPAHPEEIDRLKVCYPNSKIPRPIGEIGSVKLATTVDCHELGPKYLLFRAASSVDDRNPQSKRQLVVVGKGHQPPPSVSPEQTSTGEIDLPRLRVSFDASDGEVLATQIGGPFFSVQDTRPTSTHYRKDGQEKHAIEVFKENDNTLNPWELLKKHAGTATPGKLKDIKFKHACSVDKNINMKNLAKILHDNKELSAWLAHDSGADVIYIRKEAENPHLHDEVAGLGDLIGTLQNAGLINDYGEIRVSTSRNPVTLNKRLPIRETYREAYINAPRETDPIRTAELPMGSQSYVDWALKTAMKAKEKLSDFLGTNPD